MKKIVKWYLSGFYKKPKGLKKPYNPILGETFRCYWEHPNGSKSYYIAEQGMVFSQIFLDFHYAFRFPFPVRFRKNVSKNSWNHCRLFILVSHHPPISANYVANRQDGFTISATILAKSKVKNLKTYDEVF